MENTTTEAIVNMRQIYALTPFLPLYLFYIPKTSMYCHVIGNLARFRKQKELPRRQKSFQTFCQLPVLPPDQ